MVRSFAPICWKNSPRAPPPDPIRAARAWYRRQALSVAARYRVNPQKASIMDTLRQDIRYAIRTLVKARGFTAAVLATLTIGIGAATAIFSVLNAVVIRPLPFPDADRLMFLTDTRPTRRLARAVQSACRGRASPTGAIGSSPSRDSRLRVRPPSPSSIRFPERGLAAASPKRSTLTARSLARTD